MSDGNGAQVPFVDLNAQYATLQGEVDEAIGRVLGSSAFILGEDVERFEEEFAEYCETEHAIGVDSGTSALELALRAFDIGANDEVITAANTFIATALAISYVGARPVLVDIDADTYALDPNRVEEAITERTKAIIPVHLYGHPADMDAVTDIARRHDLVVIEDACQAHGARYKGRRVGSFGDAAAFSFYPAKNLGAYGDGGIVVSRHEDVARRIRAMRNYGQEAKYHHVVRGYNRRLDTLQAAVLRIKLRYLDAWNLARRQHARAYSELLADAPVTLPTEAAYAEPVYHLYVVRVTERDQVQEYLKQQGVLTGVHYPIAIHQQPAYEDLGYSAGSFAVTERYQEQILSLPMYAELTSTMVKRVAQVLRGSLDADVDKALAAEAGSATQQLY